MNGFVIFFQVAPIRKMSARQLELLVEFAEQNRDIVCNKCRSGPLAHQQALKAWEFLARSLNACGEGFTKTADQWRKVSTYLCFTCSEL